MQYIQYSKVQYVEYSERDSSFAVIDFGLMDIDRNHIIYDYVDGCFMGVI